mmetsp:Transcript_38454/g.105939  ORF Transcript_38454/g.105939 Transcript_38454/m.105939 type:complete len:231 (-) Transcript_38454:1019-1711(-)
MDERARCMKNLPAAPISRTGDGLFEPIVGGNHCRFLTGLGNGCAVLRLLHSVSLPWRGRNAGCDKLPSAPIEEPRQSDVFRTQRDHKCAGQIFGHADLAERRDPWFRGLRQCPRRCSNAHFAVSGRFCCNVTRTNCAPSAGRFLAHAMSFPGVAHEDIVKAIDVFGNGPRTGTVCQRSAPHHAEAGRRCFHHHSYSGLRIALNFEHLPVETEGHRSGHELRAGGTCPLCA